MPGTEQTADISAFSAAYCVQVFGYSDQKYVHVYQSPSEIELCIEYTKGEKSDDVFIVHEPNRI